MSKRDEVLKAAIACFSAYGYYKTSMSDIGRQVGMSKASLYYHFKDKFALYEAVIQHIRKEHLFESNKKIQLQNNIQDRIICLLNNELDFLSYIATNYLRGSINHDDVCKIPFDEIIRDDIDQLTKLIDEGVLLNEFEIDDPNKLAVLIIQVVQGILEVNCPLNMPDDQRCQAYEIAKERAEEVVRLILKGLKI